MLPPQIDATMLPKGKFYITKTRPVCKEDVKGRKIIEQKKS
jgi:hypothetical protein